ncbi:M56 family metallopeptidase [Mucilaginibacter lappiensis]|uniref:DNA-binding sugar fermentation-stimulating protein n=1 Tax=Mucilaginibacter lappiensis TaxID=354630 RepID=A0A841JB26_9SPHI|nr:M56 family metallopeptidase [Mucilaginibacter lappiensis]MBB6127864.1 DNA-binding sugar fermentation-stimulating protein [Mucilaginibacter lappiensis]
MESLVMYLLKANVVMSILFLFYVLLLRNDKSFKQNRFYLLFSLVLSLFLPLLPELSSPHFEPIQRQITTANPLNGLYTTIGNSQMITNHVNNAYVVVNQGFTRPSLIQILTGVYLLISTVLLVRSIIKVLKISILIKNTDKQFIDGIYYCAFDGTAPFSFFNYLVINKELFTDSELRQIIVHENVHIRQSHSIDILFVELVHAILWINPLLLYLKRCIKLNHEYIADHEVISSGVDKKNYQLSVLYNSLKVSQVYQLTNLYSSSKIKLRIKMMNLKKSPNPNAYKYAFVLLLVAANYLLINPLSASGLHKNAIETTQNFKKFEGYYAMKGRKGALIQIIATNKSVILKQLWDNRKIDFTATGPLTFSTKENASFTLQFTNDNAGRITQILAFGKDVWVKNDNYHLPVEVKLIAQDLKKFEGYYELKGQKGTFIQISSTSNGLVLKQLWDNEQIDFAAKSSLDFFAKTNPGFTLQFTSDNAGGITQVLAFGKDVWVRNNDGYHAPVEVKLTAQELKKFEGKYEFTEKEGTFIEITSTGNGLVLNQLWDNKQIGFAAASPLDFFAKTAPGFTLQFTGNNSGGITQVLAFGKDVWKKVN